MPADDITPAPAAETPQPVNTPPKSKFDLLHSEQLPMAGEFVDKAIGQLYIAVAALEYAGSGDSSGCVRKAVIRMLRDDVAKDLGAASEIFQDWKSAELHSSAKGVRYGR